MNEVAPTTNVPDRARRLLSHTAILTALLIISVVLNVFLARQSKRLGKELESDLAIIEKAEGILPDTVVPPLEVLDMSGQPIIISYAEIKSPTVLYVFSASCGWCDRNLENIKFLARSLGKDYRFVGVSLSPNQLNEYLAKANLPFPVFHSPSLSMSTTYRMGRTPQTIVVSPESRVMKSWSGAYGNLYGKATQTEIETFFRVTLPGLTPELVTASPNTGS